MEAHPIPQNVTTFQFKLIGDMTLKQFLYLAVGVGTAYLLLVFLAHDYPYVAWPLIVISGLLGVAFAFLPIESQPLDHWVGAFLKAVYSPTKRVWRKNNKTFKEDPLFSSRLVTYLSAAKPLPTVPVTVTEPSALPTKPLSAVAPATQTTQQPLPTQEELQKTVDLARQAQTLQMKIIQTERTLAQIREATTKPAQIPVDYSEEVNKILTDLQSLVAQASQVKQQIQAATGEGPTAQTAAQPPKEKIKVVIPVKPKQTQLALTTFPNVINGIVKDKTGNYLEGAVAVIYDKEGLPVRALKTNKLGQFSGSTPLPNGVYTLELEKEGFTFDVLQIELTGKVLPPLIIVAK